MPSQQVLNAFIATVEAGRHDEAIEKFYDEFGTMQENSDPPSVGRDKLVEGERVIMSKFKEIRSRHVGPVFVNGDNVVINWVFEFVGTDGKVARVIDEIAYQTWAGDKIKKERFFYDPRSRAALQRPLAAVARAGAMAAARAAKKPAN
jgi:ketosteroid isomerase-like protein